MDLEGDREVNLEGTWDEASKGVGDDVTGGVEEDLAGGEGEWTEGAREVGWGGWEKVFEEVQEKCTRNVIEV